MRVPVARLPTSSRGLGPPEARAVGDPRGWTILAGRLEALFPTGRRVESFADDLNTRRIRPSHLKHFPELARTTQEGYIPHLAWATRRAGAKSVFLKPKVETKSLTMWCAASPLAMPHGALAWCPVCGSWSAVVGALCMGCGSSCVIPSAR
ncbi:hypothetical protein Lal_00049248 [Lupinus albus]|nr:hypothetical protein Lal_00049248 [Lupinus albus]